MYIYVCVCARVSIYIYISRCSHMVIQFDMFCCFLRWSTSKRLTLVCQACPVTSSATFCAMPCHAYGDVSPGVEESVLTT